MSVLISVAVGAFIIGYVAGLVRGALAAGYRR